MQTPFDRDEASSEHVFRLVAADESFRVEFKGEGRWPAPPCRPSA
jgi:hypothetical protein